MITAIVMTKDSQQSIERVLSSLSWCAEIVVVDDYSKDQTREIARKLKARVYKRHVEEDFAAQRNFALSKAANEWVLFVDSDEVVPEPLAKEIITKLKAPGSTRGYTLRRHDYVFGGWVRHGEVGQVRIVRLGRVDAGSWTRPVHEVWAIGGVVGQLHEPLEHFPHATVSEFLRDINEYSTVNARYMFDDHTPSGLWQIVVYPVAKFMMNYFVHFGFLDGMPGMIYAVMMSFHSFLTRAKLWQLYDQSRQTEITAGA